MVVEASAREFSGAVAVSSSVGALMEMPAVCSDDAAARTLIIRALPPAAAVGALQAAVVVGVLRAAEWGMVAEGAARVAGEEEVGGRARQMQARCTYDSA